VQRIYDAEFDACNDHTYKKETLTGEYKKRFDKEISFIKKDVIEVDNIEPTIQNMETIVTNIFDILLPEYS
jgi:hypothetical protein